MKTLTNNRKATSTRKRLSTIQQERLRRGFRATHPRKHGTSWEYDLGAEIRANGEELDEGLIKRGYFPYGAEIMAEVVNQAEGRAYAYVSAAEDRDKDDPISEYGYLEEAENILLEAAAKVEATAAKQVAELRAQAAAIGEK